MSHVVIDTCCLTNITATGNAAEILSSSGLTWHVPPAVAAEVIFIRARAADGSLQRQEVDLGPLLQSAALLRTDLNSGEEIDLYVALAADLADGEAMALSIATCRGWVIATDDRKARGLAAGLGTQTITTPEIMRLWALKAGVANSTVRTTLLKVQSCARFTPAADFPEFNWWRMCVESEI
jgi:predicted nucleic acid-binding protein